MSLEKFQSHPEQRRKWVRPTILFIVAVIGVYGIVYVDVLLRAKESYTKAEQYMSWHQNPDKKKQFFDQKLERDKKELEKKYKKEDISKEEYDLRLEALEFDHNFALNESSLKYAYQWYKDTYELFSPPESPWVKKARQKAPQVLEMWKEELREKNIPFEDYMLE